MKEREIFLASFEMSVEVAHHSKRMSQSGQSHLDPRKRETES